MLTRGSLFLCMAVITLAAACTVNPEPDSPVLGPGGGAEVVVQPIPPIVPAVRYPARLGEAEIPAALSTADPGPGVQEARGIYHPLKRGLTLKKISKTYGVSVDTLMAVNRIVDATSIPSGMPIFVPGATERLPTSPQSIPARPSFVWPLKGRVTSPFGSSSKRKHHAGIDIDGETGDPIRAAQDGLVVRLADNARYGLLVVVGHEDGYATWYSHASGLAVARGDRVAQGQMIAYVGNSGNARGSHLHFEIRRHGRPVDPIPFLP